MENIYYQSSDNKTTIHACVWKPEGEVKGVLQIVHGMAEYAQRYHALAEYLVGKGFAVVAEDHLGHGQSVASEEDLGYFCKGDIVATVLQDVHELTVQAKAMFPGKPYFLMGHSMGSFYCRCYMAKYQGELQGAIVMGTGWQPSALTVTAKTLASIQGAFKGMHYRSKFIDGLAFGAYNNKWKPVRTPFDWLSVNTQNVDDYIADPLCGVLFTCNGFKGLFSVVNQACKQSTCNKVDKNLPILLVSGSEDPVGNYGTAVEKTYQAYQKAGVQDLQLILYRGFRHEILNDDCAVQVQEDINQFLLSHI